MTTNNEPIHNPAASGMDNLFNSIARTTDELGKAYEEIALLRAELEDRKTALATVGEAVTEIHQLCASNPGEDVAAAVRRVVADRDNYRSAFEQPQREVIRCLANETRVNSVVYDICQRLNIKTHIDPETPFDTHELLGTEILPAIEHLLSSYYK